MKTIKPISGGTEEIKTVSFFFNIKKKMNK